MQNRSRYTVLTDAANLFAPTFALAAASLTSITVTITPAEDTTATSYRIRYSSANGEFEDPLDYTTIERTGTFTLTGLTAGATYYFSVSAVNDVGSTTFSAAQSIAAAPVFSAIDNEDGRLSASWTQNNLVDSANDTQVIENSANGTTGWTTAATVAYNATSGYVTVNDSSLSLYYRLKVYRHSGAQTFYSNVVGPLTITGDTDAAALITVLKGTDGWAGDGTKETAIHNFFLDMRADGVLSKIADCVFPFFASATPNRRKWISLGQGSFPAGTATHNASWITFSSNGYYDFGATPTGMGLSATANGLFAILKDSPTAGTVCDIGQGGTGGEVNLFCRYTGDVSYHRFGNSSTGSLGPIANTKGAGITIQSRRSTTDAIVRHYDWTTLSTITSTSGLSGSAFPSNQNIFAGALNNGGTAASFTNRAYYGYGAVKDCTEAELDLICLNIETLLTAIGASI